MSMREAYEEEIRLAEPEVDSEDEEVDTIPRPKGALGYGEKLKAAMKMKKRPGTYLRFLVSAYMPSSDFDNLHNLPSTQSENCSILLISIGMHFGKIKIPTNLQICRSWYAGHHVFAAAANLPHRSANTCAT